MKGETTVLVWLEWPEKCFRVDAEALCHLRALVAKDTKVVRVRTERAFLKALPGATHAIVWNFKAEWFALAKKLRVLATPAAGQELVPREGPPGVTVHFGGYHGAIIAESVVGFMLAWCRGFFAVREAPDRWPRTWLSDKCRTLAGTRAVIVGYGHIGRQIGAKLEALGVSVAGITRHGIWQDGRLRKGQGPDGESRVLAGADWVVLALPSTTGTDDWLDARRLRRLPKRCVVVNVGRGNAVDEEALVAALRAGRLAGAYLDVIKREPTFLTLGTVPASDRGSVPKVLGTVPNLVVMPHASAFAPQYLRMCFDELKDEGLI